MTRFLLDTCAVIWTASGDKISKSARAAMLDAYEGNEPVRVSPISAWEVGMLVSRGRLALAGRPEDWFAKVLRTPGVTLAELPPGTLINSSFLPQTPPSDPADRMIITTARDQDLIVLTRDRRILNYAEQGHVRALAC